MKRLLTLLALVLCSCAETFVGEEATRPNNGNLPDLTAAFAEEDNTRTYIEDGKYLRWHEDDRLTIFYGNTLNRQYKFNGATGDNSGTFSLVPDGMLGTGNAFDRIYALYPYNTDARITDEGIISLTLPAEQTYAENSFGRGANTMLAVTENLEDTFLAFKNACGYLKLKLYNAEGATIKSIEVKGNSGERLAGAATATIVFGEAPIVTMAESATDTITLNCGEGVALGTTAETATEFWVTLPATTFAEGLTITATDTEGGVFEKSTTNEVIIERNAIQPMAVLEAKFVATKPANNEIWYTNGSTTEATTPYKTDVFGANIVSNTYDAAKECWVIKFDGKVTTIGREAFYKCSSLKSITIPDSVTTIGREAFYKCSSLKSITIPDSVTTIVEYAFYDCSGLTSVTIPDSLIGIGGEGAFSGCSSLTSVYISDISAWCNISFADLYSNPLSNGCNLYLNNELVTDLTIPDSVTTIGEFAFSGCSSLTSVTIPDSVTKIGREAFYKCSSLTSVTIGNSVTTIGERAFSWCESLTSVTIPNSVTTIGDDAFRYCNSLQEFNGKFASEDGRCLIIDGTLNSFAPAGLTEYTIPDSVTTIGDNAFEYCSSLTSVTIGNSVTSIGDDAFRGCGSLTSVTIPDSVTSIGDSAFSSCTSLTSVTIPDSVTTIGNSAFSWCESLTSVYCKATTPPDEGFYMFYKNASDLKIYVPMESVEAYKNAYRWSDYADAIVGYDFENGVAVTPKPAANEIWYTTTDGEMASVYDIEYIVKSYVGSYYTHYYDETNGVWVLRFDDLEKLWKFPNVDYQWFFSDNVSSVIMPDCIEEITGLEGLPNLTTITLSTNLKTIDTRAFRGCSSLAEIAIPNSVTEIRDYTFQGCSSLASITIPHSVTSIGQFAFDGCNNIKNLTIPDGVSTIYISSLPSLNSLTIGSNVTSIQRDDNRYYACYTIYCKPTTPPNGLIGNNGLIFEDVANITTIYVPRGCADSYTQEIDNIFSGHKPTVIEIDF